jgi:BirA family biotin operon repressor/biotin-[acetyl-CoA-carboxylase] ligase
VTAAEQSAGRGRQGRTWSAPAGRALLASVVVRDPPALLPLVAAVAVADAVAARASAQEVRIKWPNDVLLGGRKVAGILAEGRLQEGWAVLGVGLNVALDPAALPAELRETAASMGLRPADVEPVLAELLDALGRRLAGDQDTVLAAWRERDALRGRDVAWAGGSGRAAGVDGGGRLLVELPGGGRTALDAGEVHLRRER